MGKLNLKSGQVLAVHGSKFWVIDAQTGKTVWKPETHEPMPDLELRIDPVLRELLLKVEAEFDWLKPFAKPDLYEKILDSHAARNHLDLSLEQTPVLPSTVYRRVHLLPPGKRFRVLLVGDDDLLSLPLAILGHQVTVFEIDPFTIKTIRYFQEKWNLPDIEIHSHDLCQPLPPNFLNQYDYCFTDPLSTYNCLNVFMSRAIGALKQNGELWIALSDAGDPIGRHLAEMMQLTMVQRYRYFNFYYTMRFVFCHYMSHYLHFRKNEKTKPLIAVDQSFSGDLFSYENSYDHHAIDDFYNCEIFEKHSSLEIMKLLHQVIGEKTSFVLPSEQYPDLAFFSWQGKSVRIRLNAKRKWAGIDSVPLQRNEAFELKKKFLALLKPERTTSRVSERNPGRE